MKIKNIFNNRRPASPLSNHVVNGFVAFLFVIFSLNILKSWLLTKNIQPLLLLIQESVIIGLLLFRRPPKDTTKSLSDWAVTIICIALPLFFRPNAQHQLFTSFAILLQLSGIVLVCIANLSLGRSFGIVAANRGVKTRGAYQLVRHPIYTAYMIGQLGFLLGNITWLNCLVLTLDFICFYKRAEAEEKVLLSDSDYRHYTKQVRYKFLPFIF